MKFAKPFLLNFFGVDKLTIPMTIEIDLPLKKIYR